MSRQRLEQLVRCWRRQLVLRDGLYALAVGNAFLLLALWQPALFRWQLPLLALIGTFATLLTVSRPWLVDPLRLASHLDRTYPQVEESTALFLRSPDQLTLLERLQQNRVEETLTGLPASTTLGEPPRDFLRAASLCLAVPALLAAGCGLFFLRPAKTAPPPTGLEHQGSAAAILTSSHAASLAPKILAHTFTITPPAYTGRPPRRIEGFTAEAEEGSTVTWNLTLDQPIRAARLTTGNVTLPLAPTPDHHQQTTATATASALFTLTATLPDGTAWSPPELFSLKVIPDQPPSVRLLQPAQPRTEITPPATTPILVEALISDDYAVADAHLVATVAKGSGEAVKFREQNLPFDTGTPADTPRTHRFTRLLDLSALGLEPGDELYFFVEAHDNRQPTPNRTRSETRFLTLRGPDEKKTTTGRGVVGVNLVPAYFRSERQIILDTEKLLADRPAIPDVDFRSRANDLGADQSFLRLRYGRFLGEDQEESPLTDHLEANTDPLQARAPAQAPGPHAAASIAERFKQEHVEQDREGGGDDEAAPRPPANGAPLTATQIRQPFVDSHDQHDKNTFFDSQTKGTMHDALAAMWDAEGFLRTARPQEALTPEHRALEILKDLQQSARAYVQHVGFDAPPLKVNERRLKGETTDIPPRTALPANPAPPDSDAKTVRDALAELRRTGTLSIETLGTVEPALTAAATRQPDRFFPGLQLLRHLRATDSDPATDQAALIPALLALLPPANPLPVRPADPAPALAAPYFQQLQPGAPSP